MLIFKHYLIKQKFFLNNTIQFCTCDFQYDFFLKPIISLKLFFSVESVAYKCTVDIYFLFEMRNTNSLCSQYIRTFNVSEKKYNIQLPRIYLYRLVFRNMFHEMSNNQRFNERIICEI